jgi:hypothetical protein
MLHIYISAKNHWRRSSKRRRTYTSPFANMPSRHKRECAVGWVWEGPSSYWRFFCFCIFIFVCPTPWSTRHACYAMTPFLGSWSSMLLWDKCTDCDLTIVWSVHHMERVRVSALAVLGWAQLLYPRVKLDVDPSWLLSSRLWHCHQPHVSLTMLDLQPPFETISVTILYRHPHCQVVLDAGVLKSSRIIISIRALRFLRALATIKLAWHQGY